MLNNTPFYHLMDQIKAMLDRSEKYKREAESEGPLGFNNAQTHARVASVLRELYRLGEAFENSADNLEDCCYWFDEHQTRCNNTRFENFDYCAKHLLEALPEGLSEEQLKRARIARGLVENLAAHIRQICAYPKSVSARERAMEFLHRHNLQGTVMRKSS